MSRVLVHTAMNRRVPYTAEDFLTSWETVSYSRRTMLNGVSWPIPQILHCLPWWKEEPSRCYLVFYYTYDMLTMFRVPLCSSSGAHNYIAAYHMEVWFLGCWWLEVRCRLAGCSPCFGHLYAHHQELKTISLLTTWKSESWVVDGWRLGVGWLDAQHVSGTSMPIIRSSRLYLCLPHGSLILGLLMVGG
jgi:hypothetical protein